MVGRSDRSMRVLTARVGSGVGVPTGSLEGSCRRSPVRMYSAGFYADDPWTFNLPATINLVGCVAGPTHRRGPLIETVLLGSMAMLPLGGEVEVRLLGAFAVPSCDRWRRGGAVDRVESTNRSLSAF